MKKTTLRRHGYAAKAAALVEACPSTPRLKTSVTFQANTQNYCWTTDRGRSRLIKH